MTWESGTQYHKYHPTLCLRHCWSHGKVASYSWSQVAIICLLDNHSRLISYSNVDSTIPSVEDWCCIIKFGFSIRTLQYLMFTHLDLVLVSIKYGYLCVTWGSNTKYLTTHTTLCLRHFFITWCSYIPPRQSVHIISYLMSISRAILQPVVPRLPTVFSLC